MMTLLLNREAMVQSVEALTLLSQLRDSFAEPPSGLSPHSQSVALHQLGSMHAQFPGQSPRIPAYTVRIDSLFGAAPQSPHSTVLLYDLRNGELLALLEGNYLSNLSCALVHTLAMDELAPPDVSKVAILGATDASRRQLKSFRLARSLKDVKVYDANILQSHPFAEKLFQELSLPTHAVESVDEAIDNAELIIIDGAHKSFSPQLKFPPRTHVACLSPVSQIQGVSHFCDTLDEQQIPVANELGSLLRKETPARDNSPFATGFSYFGTPMVDLVAAWHVYQAALENDSVSRMKFA